MPAMRKHAPVLAALATSIVMVSCAAGPAGAREQATMSAATQDSTIPFHDPAIVPLAEAVARGDAGQIRALAPAADLSAHGDQNVTLPEWAIWTQQPEALAALLEAGADAGVAGMDGESVAHMAAMADDPEYLRVLVAHGAPVELVGARGKRTPIFRAIESRRDAQFELLVKAGADIDRADSMGDTPLHVAALVMDADRVLQLLQLGADPGAKNHRGDTFQDVLFAGGDERLNAAGKASRQRVRDWLSAHGIALRQE
jgi:ankyrin repeat protein